MNKLAITHVVKFDENLAAIFRKKNGSIFYTIHLRKFNGVRLLGNGPIIFTRQMVASSIEEAISIRDKETMIDFYVPEGQDKPDNNKIKKIAISDRHSITVTYGTEVEGMPDASIEIEVHEQGMEDVKYSFIYSDNIILASLVSESGSTATKSFKHNGEEVFSIS